MSQNIGVYGPMMLVFANFRFSSVLQVYFWVNYPFNYQEVKSSIFIFHAYISGELCVFSTNLSPQKEKRGDMRKKKRENPELTNLLHACTESLKVSGGDWV